MALADYYNQLMGRVKDFFAPITASANAPEPGEDKPRPEQEIKVSPTPFASVSLKELNLLNDDSVYAVYSIFKDILLGSGFTWEGKDVEANKDFLDALTNAPGWAEMLDALASVWFQRLAAIEIVWDTEGASWTPKKYRVLPLNSTSLDLDELQNVALVHVTTTGGLQDLPPQNAIVHRYRPTFQFPLGQSVYDRLKEVIDYKRRADAALIRIAERLAGASIIGYYAPGTDKAAQTNLLNALKKLQSASVGIIPGPKGDKGNEIDLLELQSSAGLDLLVQMLQMYERRIARAVLGSILAVFESEFGTRAQSETHLKILQQVVGNHQADTVEQPLNEQLVKPYIRYNVPGGDKKDIRWKLNAPDFSDLQKVSMWVESLVQSGVLDPLDQADNDLVRKLFGLELRSLEDAIKEKNDLPLLKGGQAPPKVPNEPGGNEPSGDNSEGPDKEI